MKSKPMIHEMTEDLFRSELRSILNLRHELCLLSEQIDWASLDQELGKLFPSNKGCPAIPTRLIMGLFFLKATYQVSDEDLPRRWVENPYWQYFCGEQYLKHELPIHPTSLSKWRKRLKGQDLERLLLETIKVGLTTKTIKKSELKQTIADTTVQEKAITYPTDGKLYQHARELLVKEAKAQGLSLKQSYVHLGKKAAFQASRYIRARQMKRAKRELKKLKTYLGRVSRDIERQLKEAPNVKPHFKDLLLKTKQLLEQKRDSKNKLYSLHAPEVECISKGKAHKRYEFGVKVSVVTPLKKSFVIGVQSLPGNPYDGHTLKSALDQVERLIGKRPQACFVDLGYRGNQETETTVYAGHKKRGVTRTLQLAMKRRSSVEPLIGHMKSEGHLGRNYLKGQQGDVLNAFMSAIGFNLRQILNVLWLFWLYFLRLFFNQSEFLTS